jgi:hypothetical protein
MENKAQYIVGDLSGPLTLQGKKMVILSFDNFPQWQHSLSLPQHVIS